MENNGKIWKTSLIYDTKNPIYKIKEGKNGSSTNK